MAEGKGDRAASVAGVKDGEWQMALGLLAEMAEGNVQQRRHTQRCAWRLREKLHSAADSRGRVAVGYRSLHSKARLRHAGESWGLEVGDVAGAVCCC